MSDAFDLKIDEVIADKVANLAVERIDSETIEKMIKETLNRVSWEKTGEYKWESKPTRFQEIVMRHFYASVSEKIEAIVKSDKFVDEASEVASRIVSDARIAAEKYMIEKLALKMCLTWSDFDGEINQINMSNFIGEIMNNHLRDCHNNGIY